MSISPGPRVRNGSARARVASEEEEEDVDMNGVQQDENEDEGGAGAVEDEEEEHEGGEEISPEEQLKQKRDTRASYRQLALEVEGTRMNLLDVSVDDMSAQVEQANELFKNVQAPSEAILDSRVLMAASDAGALKARQLKLDANAFDTDEFLVKLLQFMGGRAAGKGRRARREGSEEGDSGMKWDRVGRVLAGESRRVPVMDFMYGPLAIATKEKKARTQRAQYKADESQRVRPEEVDAADSSKDPQETTKMVAALNKVLEDEVGVTGLPYLQFIINPHSFAQSVENMFFFSFLVKEGKAAIEIDEDEDSPNFGDAVAFACETATAEDVKNLTKHQLVFELTMDVWQDAIKAYDIKESIIPSRAIPTVLLNAQGKRAKW